MKVLITGASGFIGQALAEYLEKEGLELFSLGARPSGSCVHFPLANLAHKKSVDDAIQIIKPDYVFHLAGSSLRSLRVEDAFAVNAFYCSSLLEAIDKAGMGLHTKIAIVGSAAEYGKVEANQLPVAEDLACMPTSLYGISKFAQTQMALSWQNGAKRLLVVRPFNVVGPNMPQHSPLGDFKAQIDSIDTGGVLWTGSLDIYRDYIAATDVVRLLWRLINNEEAYGNIFNLCTGVPVCLNTVVNSLDSLFHLLNAFIEISL